MYHSDPARKDKLPRVSATLGSDSTAKNCPVWDHILPGAAHSQWLLDMGYKGQNLFDPLWYKSEGHIHRNLGEINQKHLIYNTIWGFHPVPYFNFSLFLRNVRTWFQIPPTWIITFYAPLNFLLNLTRPLISSMYRICGKEILHSFFLSLRYQYSWHLNNMVWNFWVHLYVNFFTKYMV